MITANNLKKSYQGFSLNVNFDISEGCITGFVGKNGAGKSTIIKLILGLIQPDEGEITVMGTETKYLTGVEKEKTGVALAESGFSPHLTVKDIEKILKKSYREFDEQKFCSLCQKMLLPYDKAIKTFSTGMKAKLRVIVALTHNAKLLIMDEPTSGLDVETRVEVLDMIREYMIEDESRSIIITSHISSDLESICDDIYLIDNGEIIIHEDTDVILGECGVIKVDEDKYSELDKTYLLKSIKTNFGYACFTKEKRFYQENYPGIVIENGSIDDMILMLSGGVGK